MRARGREQGRERMGKEEGGGKVEFERGFGQDELGDKGEGISCQLCGLSGTEKRNTNG